MYTRLVTCDDVELVARRRLGEQPRAAVVLAHGFTASAEHPDLVAVAEALHARNLDVITYDARGHGGSGGECTLGDLERHDVDAAVQFARERTPRVVLVGASMGAIAVLRHAADDPDVAGTVTVSAPARWTLPLNPRSLLAAAMTRTPPGRALAQRFLRVSLAARWTNPAPPVELMTRVTGPVAVIHGDADRFIPLAAAHELHAAARPPARLTVVPGMGHAFESRAVTPVVDAVEWALAEPVVVAGPAVAVDPIAVAEA
jgi:pimeloyl-ACP methyl ester carboxylesterase